MLRNFNGHREREKKRDWIGYGCDYVVFFLFLIFVFHVIQDYNSPDLNIAEQEKGFYIAR